VVLSDWPRPASTRVRLAGFPPCRPAHVSPGRIRRPAVSEREHATSARLRDDDRHGTPVLGRGLVQPEPIVTLPPY
jgi:hypothetical protein